MKNNVEIDLSRKVFQAEKLIVYGAAAWAIAFGILHIAWAAGWYIGLPAEQARAAFGETWFLVYDLIAAALCVVAAVVAVKISSPKKHPPHRFLKLLAWCGTTVLALRAIAGFVKILYLTFSGKSVFEWAQFWEIWFCLGAILFGVAIWRFKNTEVLH